MDYKAIGLRTGKVYATGSKADCLRELHKKYPSKEQHEYFKNGVSIPQVLPEAILLVK